MPAESRREAIEAFAERHGLDLAEVPEPLRAVPLLQQSDPDFEPAANGKLPGGIEGALFHYTYTTTDSDNDTHYHPFTVVATLVPESMGFAPSLGFSAAASGVSARVGGSASREVELAEDRALSGASLYAYEGINERWLTELVSPSLIDWLARSPDDFGFQLASGALCAARNSHLTAAADLEALCTEASHIAQALRTEAVEEIESGGAEAAAAKRPQTADDVMVANAMRKFGADRDVPDVSSTVAQFRRMILRNPGTWLFKFATALLILLVLNVPAVALPIVLITNGQYALLAAIEGALLLIIFFFVMRSHVRGNAAKYATESFFRAYAPTAAWPSEEPLHFSATHAESGLPFTPERVLSGSLPGGTDGALAVVGTGLKRADRIALVAGPRGPVAVLGLEVSPPGLSAEDLDRYAVRLGRELSA